MKHIIAPFPDNESLSLSRVFLAGCANTDWRKDFVQYFSHLQVVMLDPKRDDWNLMDKSKMKEQVTWEYNNLRKADIIVYFFNAGSVCPITLLEYGMWGLSKGTPIIVGVTSDYEKRDDVILQTKLARPDIRVVNDLYELSYETKSKLDELDNDGN